MILLILFVFAGFVIASWNLYNFMNYVSSIKDQNQIFKFEEPYNTGTVIVSSLVRHALQYRFQPLRTQGAASNLFQKHYLESLMKHGEKVTSKKITDPIFSIFKSDYFGTELIIITRYEDETLVTFVCFLESFDSTLLFQNPDAVET